MLNYMCRTYIITYVKRTYVITYVKLYVRALLKCEFKFNFIKNIRHKNLSTGDIIKHRKGVDFLKETFLPIPEFELTTY